MQSFSLKIHSEGKKIGFVPTMGALHEGHLSLIRGAKKECDTIIVSIFVNPTQFGPNEDYKKYPRTFKKDRKLLQGLKVDAIFLPSAADMYPEGYKTYVEVKSLGEKLCGRSRLNHFKGVTTIVAKLFNIVKPDIAYFGAKDFQQQVIIKKMVKDLNMGLVIRTIQTAREKDGLALSSRNAYLSREQRNIAPLIYKSLLSGKKMVDSGTSSLKAVVSSIKTSIQKEKAFRIDYFEVVDPETLEPVSTKKKGSPVLIAIAAYLGKTRLIDNILIK